MVDDRGLRQKALASKIGITESSFSRILTGKARPRQLTFSRLMKELSPTAAEKQRLLSAYDYSEIAELPEQPASPEIPTPEDEIDRVKRYLEVKSMAVTFNEDVAKALDGTERFFERAYRQGSLICDFLLPGPPRIGVECKYNINRDWDRTVTTVQLLKKELDLETVIVAVPYENDTTLDESDRVAEVGGKIVAVADLEVSVGLLIRARTEG